MPVPHVIIVGAGVGGLAVAQGLKKRNISFSVYERDGLLDSRRQGNRIKITGDLKAKLMQLIPEDVFKVVEDTCASTFVGETNVNATDGSITACRVGRLPPGIPPPLTADRGLLRHALMTGISDFVHFGQEFDRYEELEAGTPGAPGVRVFFRDRSTQIAALLLGVDGSRSRVRQQLVPGASYIQDTDTCCVYGKTTLNAELQERFPESYRRWLTIVRDEAPLTQNIIFGDGPVVMVLEACHFSNRDVYPHVPTDYVHWGIMFGRSMLRMQGKDLDFVLEDGAKLALDLTAEWHSSVRSLVELQDAPLTVGTRIYSAPLKIPAWNPSAVVTVLGDAAHVMSPAGGVGAVAALHDAFGVVEMVANENLSVESIARFEQGMRGLAETLLQRTDVASRRMLNVGLPQ
ncbi:FAD/NAD(P)-binding domain-containing protein [Byssothecium circinans]|uniref:FAD/NAD(P)-binding domain-containing protein n=1 Tax=Byssothecium circinans TaxID=147558 RepID=A0A6A5THD8_9PLEO|nr:FAD/NAD(P)-binding domain-containing protein [Byssothecium circinans]